MSIVDKIAVIKQILQVVIKVVDVLVGVMNTILEKLGDNN